MRQPFALLGDNSTSSLKLALIRDRSIFDPGRFHRQSQNLEGEWAARHRPLINFADEESRR